MRVILKGALADGGSGREMRVTFDAPVTREALLADLAKSVPGLERYLAMNAETGRAPPLLILSGGNWVYPGDLVGDDATVEIHPPIAGG